MSEQNITKPLKQRLLKIGEIILVFLFAVFMAVFLAFHYEELGQFFTVTLVILVVVLFFPKFLRRNFQTDKNQNLEAIKGIDFQSSIGSFLWTRTDETGFFPYREFVTRIRPKLMKKQLQGKVYYIDLKTKCLILAIQLLHMIFFVFAFSFIGKIKESILTIFLILTFMIFFTKSCDKTRNFIIRKFAKNIDKT